MKRRLGILAMFAAINVAIGAPPAIADWTDDICWDVKEKKVVACCRYCDSEDCMCYLGETDVAPTGTGT